MFFEIVVRQNFNIMLKLIKAKEPELRRNVKQMQRKCNEHITK